MATVRHLGLLPFCIANEFPEDLLAISFPVGVSLDQLLKWFWRVKKWKAVYTIQQDTVSGGETHSNEVIFWNNSVSTFVGNEFETVSPETEKDFVCKNGTNYADFYDPDLGLSGFSFNLFNGLVVRQGDLYYPSFGCSAGYQLSFISAGSIALETEDETTIDFDGITVPAFLFNAVSGSLSISIHEYWPYDPGDGGGPIYDSTTGAQLREFP